MPAFEPPHPGRFLREEVIHASGLSLAEFARRAEHERRDGMHPQIMQMFQDHNPDEQASAPLDW